MRKYAAIAAVGLIAALAFFTLGPLGTRPYLGTASLERFLAYGLLGGLLGIALPRRRWLAIVLVVALAGSLELLQFATPDRHGRLADFLIKALGGTIGSVLGLLVPVEKVR